ncbi:P2X purinoceptor 4 [Hypsibius exemplaris]|uniref:P2X purinoceptor 4 n=1 Tax=Hypsibius exemplaris TaxID=2072580 RepID=A0A1W0WB09_HYPEX|nr:P2X purinoceptor 4 [Hypsibius exemplaris]
MAPWESAHAVSDKCLQRTGAFLFEYETPRVVTLRSYRVGSIYRIVQLCIIAYLIGYVFEVWDAVDFVVPPQESGAFFVATSILYTGNQSQSTCPEDANVGKKGIHCLVDSECKESEPTPYGNGIKTGRCVDWDANTRTCEIAGWCPAETDETPNFLSGFESLTVLVKHHVAFAKYGVKRRNILETVNQTYLHDCRFHPTTDPLCPIFSISDIVEFAQEDITQIAVRGGIIGFNIDWDCDLDFDVKYCVPQYSFRRLDNKNDKIAKGWNFRHAYYHFDPSGKSRRDLVKLWGIRFVFNVNGRAGKFSAVNFAMNLGSGLGLLGIASLICEFVLFNCMSNKSELLAQKFTKLSDPRSHRPLTRIPDSPSVARVTAVNHPNQMMFNNGNCYDSQSLYGNYDVRRPPLVMWDEV